MIDYNRELNGISVRTYRESSHVYVSQQRGVHNMELLLNDLEQVRDLHYLLTRIIDCSEQVSHRS